MVAGVGLGNPMNLAMVIAVYASMSARNCGVPLRFPGKPGAYTSLIEMTDADCWRRRPSGRRPTLESRNEAYNITNGDLFRWDDDVAEARGFLRAGRRTAAADVIDDVMADKTDVWSTMVQRHGLVPTPYGDVSSWPFGDFVFSWDYDVIADTSKSRRPGSTSTSTRRPCSSASSSSSGISV